MFEINQSRVEEAFGFFWGRQILALVLALFVSIAVCAADPVEIVRAATLTDTEQKTLLAKVVPTMESLAKRKFAKVPKIEFAPISKLLELLIDEQVAIGYWPEFVPENYSLSQLDRASLTAQLRPLATNMVAKYFPVLNMVVIVPNNLFKTLQVTIGSESITSERLKAALKVVAIHELFHGLQFQNSDKILLNLLFGENSEEEIAVNTSILEGHAVLFQNLISAELGLKAADQMLMRTLEPNFERYMNAGVGQINNVIAEVTQGLYYTRGLSFMAHHYQHYGSEKLWDILLSPLPSSSTIFHPPAYNSPDESGQSVDELISQLTAQWFVGEKENWKSGSGIISPFKLATGYHLQNFDSATIDALMGNISQMNQLSIVDDLNTVALEVKLYKLRGTEVDHLGLIQIESQEIFKKHGTLSPEMQQFKFTTHQLGIGSATKSIISKCIGIDCPKVVRIYASHQLILVELSITGLGTESSLTETAESLIKKIYEILDTAGLACRREIERPLK